MGNEYKNTIKIKKAEADNLMTKKQLTDCNIAIHTASVAAGAGGAIPVPVMDAVPITAAQVTMVVALGKIFNQKVTESAAKGIIGAAASTLVGRGLVKLIPVAGWIASAAVAAGVTEAIGWTVAVDFANAHKKDVDLKMAEVEKEYEAEKQEELRKAREVYRQACEEDEDLSNSEIDSNCEESDIEDSATTTTADAAQAEEYLPYENQEPEKETESDSDDESISNDFEKIFGE